MLGVEVGEQKRLTCPFCATEKIDDALACQHCGLVAQESTETLDAGAARPAGALAETATPTSATRSSGWRLVGALVLLLGLTYCSLGFSMDITSDVNNTEGLGPCSLPDAEGIHYIWGSGDAGGFVFGASSQAKAGPHGCTLGTGKLACAR